MSLPKLDFTRPSDELRQQISTRVLGVSLSLSVVAELQNVLKSYNQVLLSNLSALAKTPLTIDQRVNIIKQYIACAQACYTAKVTLPDCTTVTPDQIDAIPEIKVAADKFVEATDVLGEMSVQSRDALRMWFFGATSVALDVVNGIDALAEYDVITEADLASMRDTCFGDLYAQGLAKASERSTGETYEAATPCQCNGEHTCGDACRCQQ